MSKGLKALERIGKCYIVSESKDLMFTDNYGNDYDIIEKELKALEILKKTKNIEVYFFDNGKRHYRIKFNRTREQEISQEEFDLLKEVL